MNSKNCTTHFFACDCREEKFRELQAENEKLRECLYRVGKDLLPLGKYGEVEVVRQYIWMQLKTSEVESDT